MEIADLLQAVAVGQVSVAQALEVFLDRNSEPVGDYALVDHQRSARTGIPEVVFGMGKTPQQIAQILQKIHDRSHQVALATKITPPVFAQVFEQVFREMPSRSPQLRFFPEAQICCLGNPPTPRPVPITIVTAGTGDIPIAEEAAVTLELSGFMPQKLWDVGVAGIHRLLDRLDLLKSADVIIVVAGMEGALASVVAGLVNSPVIAVPTSIGYGAHFGGITPLLAMVNSCAGGVAVVNIDNGFGAAVVALKFLLRSAQTTIDRSP